MNVGNAYIYGFCVSLVPGVVSPPTTLSNSCDTQLQLTHFPAPVGKNTLRPFPPILNPCLFRQPTTFNLLLLLKNHQN